MQSSTEKPLGTKVQCALFERGWGLVYLKRDLYVVLPGFELTAIPPASAFQVLELGDLIN